MFFNALTSKFKQKMYWQLWQARQIEQTAIVRPLPRSVRWPLLLAAAPFFIVLPSLADGNGGDNPQPYISWGSNGGAGGGGGSGGLGGASDGQTPPHILPGNPGLSNGTGGAGGDGNVNVSDGEAAAGGVGGLAGNALAPEGGNGGVGGDITAASNGAGGGGGGGDGMLGSITGVTASIIGGNGGNGGTYSGTADGQDGAAGGGAGAGAVIDVAGTMSTSVNITGGTGGNGGNPGTNGAGGFGGGGGSGVRIISDGVSLTNTNTILGGNGGAGGSSTYTFVNRGGNGGAGGAGITSLTGLTTSIINQGTVEGGDGGSNGTHAGGADRPAAPGGAGMIGSNMAIVNSGVITGGMSGDGLTQADSVNFLSGANSLELQAGWVLNGNIIGETGSTNTLILGGDTTVSGGDGISINTTFDLSQIGEKYQGISAFEKTGASTWDLTGTTDSTAPWTIAAGTLEMGAANAIANSSGVTVNSGGTLALNDFDQTINGLAGDGSVTLGRAKLTANNDSGDDTTFSGGISGTGSLVKEGAGTLTLAGENSYSGTTTINDGELVMGVANAIAHSSGVTVNSGGTLALNDFDQTINALSGDGSVTLGSAKLTANNDSGDDTTFSGGISGTGSLVKEGAGTLTLAGDNTYSGGTAINDGTLQIGNGGTSGSITGDIANAGNLVFNRSDDNAYGGVISGTGSLDKEGAGTLTLTGENSYSGATTINDGALVMGVANAIANSSGVTVNSGGTLALNDFDQTINGLSGDGSVTLGSAKLTANNDSGDDTTFSGGISGEGSLVKTGAGTLTLAGDNTYSGGTTIDEGTLQIGNGGTSGSITGDIANAGNLVFNRSDDNAYGGVISGTGSLDKEGAGTLTLTGENSYSGATTINDGALVMGVANAIAHSSGVTINSGGTLALNDFDQTINGLAGTGTVTLGSATLLANNDSGNDTTFSGVISGEGGLVKEGAGTLTLAGENTYTGATAINDGALVMGVANAIANSSGVTINSDGTLALNDFDQTINGLAGDGAVTLGSATLLANNDSGDDTTFSGGISGTGSLVKEGAGTLTLAGENSYSGTTTINDGELVMGAPNAIAHSSGVTINAGGTLALNDFDQTISGLAGDGAVTLGSATLLANNDSGNDTTFSGVISGEGGLVKEGAGTLTLAGENSYSGTTTINDGTLQIGNGGASGSINGDINNMGTLIFNRSDDTTYAGTLSGTGNVLKVNSNTLELTGNSSGFTGITTVSDGILLLADNAALGGSIEVVNGGAIEGSGAIGSLTIGNGGFFGPGDPNKTLVINGDLTLAANSRFLVAVNPDSTSTDLVYVKGKTTLDSDSVIHVGRDGNYLPFSTYTILISDGGIVGTFGSVSSNYAFLTPSLNYTTDSVTMSLLRNQVDFATFADTPNQRAVANGAQSVGSGGIFDAIVSLASGDVPQALNQISGEFFASTKAALIEDSHFVRDAANDRLLTAFGHSVAVTQARMPGQSDDDVTTWGQAFGSWGSTGATSDAGKLDRSTGGLLFGADKLLKHDVLVGVLGGASFTDMSVDNRNSTGTSDNYHLGAYGGTQWNNLALRSAVAYSWHDIDSTRTPSFSTFSDRDTADYRANTFQASTELGYTIPAGQSKLEPFANLTYVKLHTNGFSENGGAAALDVSSSDTEATFTTLGLRSATDFLMGKHVATLKGTLGWRHKYDATTPTTTQVFSGGEDFTVTGVPISEDAAVVEVGLEVPVTVNAKVNIAYGGQFGSSSSRDQSAMARFNWSF